MGLMSPTHLVFLGVLALLLFGAKRLPEMARSLGTGMREFKTSVSGEETTHLPAAAELVPGERSQAAERPAA
jgi:sec-independent protein translocase protein TatA